MENKLQRIAFGGGCHWCTEAVFQSLKGVVTVEQGFVASTDEYASFSEAVIVHFSSKIIPLVVLVEIHLNTHKSTSNHSMRDKYRSAIYSFNTEQDVNLKQMLKEFQIIFNDALITQILPFKSFKPSEAQFKDYYYSNPEKPFCKTFINPKLKLLLERFSKYVK